MAFLSSGGTAMRMESYALVLGGFRWQARPLWRLGARGQDLAGDSCEDEVLVAPL